MRLIVFNIFNERLKESTWICLLQVERDKKKSIPAPIQILYDMRILSVVRLWLGEVNLTDDSQNSHE